MSDIERHFDKVVKILARVAGGSTPGERAAAALLVSKFLHTHPLPIRWFVDKGTRCQVVPSLEMKDLTKAHALIRVVELPKARWFTERERVRKDDLPVLNAGYLYFESNMFAIFIPVESITPRL